MFSREFLQREYVGNKKSTTEIPKEFGGSPAQVLRDLHKFNIPLRPKSNKGQQFKLSHRVALSEARKGKHLGAENNNWRGGASKKNLIARLDARYSSWRRMVLRYKGDKCEQCGKGLLECCSECGHRPDRHVHHIEPFVSNPEKRYTLANGKVLCEKCHRLLKTGLIRWNSQVDNAEPAGEIAKGSLGVCDGQA